MSGSDNVDTSSDDSPDDLTVVAGECSRGIADRRAKPHLVSLELLATFNQHSKLQFNDSCDCADTHHTGAAVCGTNFAASADRDAKWAEITRGKSDKLARDCCQRSCGDENSKYVDDGLDRTQRDAAAERGRGLADDSGDITPTFSMSSSQDGKCDDSDIIHGGTELEACGENTARSGGGVSDFSFGSSATDDNDEGLEDVELPDVECEMPSDWRDQFWHWEADIHNQRLSAQNTQLYDDAESCSDDFEDVEDDVVAAEVAAEVHNFRFSGLNSQKYDESLACSDHETDDVVSPLSSSGNDPNLLLGCCEGSGESFMLPSHKSYGTCTGRSSSDVRDRGDGFNIDREYQLDNSRTVDPNFCPLSRSSRNIGANRYENPSGLRVDRTDEDEAVAARNADWSYDDECGLTDLDFNRRQSSGTASTSRQGNMGLDLLHDPTEEDESMWEAEKFGKSTAEFHSIPIQPFVSKMNAHRSAAGAAAVAAAVEAKRAAATRGARPQEAEAASSRWPTRTNFRYQTDGLDSAGCSPKDDDEEEFTDEEEAKEDDVSTSLYGNKKAPGVGSYQSSSYQGLPPTKHIDSSFGSRLHAATMDGGGTATSFMSGASFHGSSSADNFHHSRYGFPGDRDESLRPTQQTEQMTRMMRRRQARREREAARFVAADNVEGYRGKEPSIDELINFIDSKPPPAPQKDDKSGGGRKSKKKKKTAAASMRSQHCDTDSNGEAESNGWQPENNSSGLQPGNKPVDQMAGSTRQSDLGKNRSKGSRKKAQKSQKILSNNAENVEDGGLTVEKPLDSESCFHRVPEDFTSGDSDMELRTAAGPADSVFWHDVRDSSVSMASSCVEVSSPVSCGVDICGENTEVTSAKTEKEENCEQETASSATVNETLVSCLEDTVISEVSNDGCEMHDTTITEQMSEGHSTPTPTPRPATAAAAAATSEDNIDGQYSAESVNDAFVSVSASIATHPVQCTDATQPLNTTSVHNPAAGADNPTVSSSSVAISESSSTSRPVSSHTGTSTPSSTVSDTRESMDSDCRSLADDNYYSSDVDVAERSSVDDTAFTVVTVRRKKKPSPGAATNSEAASSHAGGAGFSRRTWVNSEMKYGAAAAAARGSSRMMPHSNYRTNSAFNVPPLRNSVYRDISNSDMQDAANSGLNDRTMENTALYNTQRQYVHQTVQNPVINATVVYVPSHHFTAGTVSNVLYTRSEFCPLPQLPVNNNYSVNIAAVSTETAASVDVCRPIDSAATNTVLTEVSITNEIPCVTMTTASISQPAPASLSKLAPASVSQPAPASVVACVTLTSPPDSKTAVSSTASGSSTSVTSRVSASAVFLDTRHRDLALTNTRPDISFGFEVDLSYEPDAVAHEPTISRHETGVSPLAVELSRQEPEVNADSFCDLIADSDVNRESGPCENDSTGTRPPPTTVSADVNADTSHLRRPSPPADIESAVRQPPVDGSLRSQFDIYGAQQFLYKEFEQVLKSHQHTPQNVVYFRNQ